LIDTQSGAVTRLVQSAEVRSYGISPNGKYLAYTTGGGFEPNTQQPIYDLMLVALASGAKRPLAKGIRMAYGSEWSWSPHSLNIAYCAGGQRAHGELSVVGIEGGEPRKLGGTGVPRLGGNGEQAPLWGPESKNIFAIGADGKIWRLDTRSATVNAAVGIENRTVIALVHHPHSGLVWSSTVERAITDWAVAL